MESKKLYLQFNSIHENIELNKLFNGEFNIFLSNFFNRIQNYLIERLEFEPDFILDERNFDQYFLMRNANDKKEYALQNFKEFNFLTEEDENLLFEIDEIFNRRTFFKTSKMYAKKHDDLFYLDHQYMKDMWCVVDFDPFANTDPNNPSIYPYLLGSNKYPNSPSKMIRFENVLYPANFTEWWAQETAKISWDEKPIELNENCLQKLFTVTRNKGFKLLNSTKVFLADFEDFKTFNIGDSKLKLLNNILHKIKYTPFNIENIIAGNWDSSSFQELKEPSLGLKANRKNLVNLEKELSLMQAYLDNDVKTFSHILNSEDEIDPKSMNSVIKNLILNHLKVSVNVQKLTREEIVGHIKDMTNTIHKKICKLNNDHKLLENMCTKRQLYVIVWDYYQINREGLMKMFVKKMFNTGYVYESNENEMDTCVSIFE
jgi:hypothetical protein